MTIAAGIAVRFTHPAHASAPRDVARVVIEGDVVMAALANGYEHGFARVWRAGASMLLDRFVEAWAASAGNLAPRLARAVAGATDAFLREAGALVSDPDAEEMGAPDASLLAIACAGGGELFAIWSGPAQALVVRDGAIRARTAPHSLHELLRAQGHEPAVARQAPRVITRLLGIDRANGEVPALGSLGAIAAGDWCVLLGAELAHALDDDTIVALAAGAPSPQALADALVAREVAGEDAPFHAACVIRWS